MLRRTLLAAAAGAAVAVVSTGLAAGYDLTSSTPGAGLDVAAYYVHGPGAGCNGDSCGVGAVDPVRFRTPTGQSAYEVVVSVSFSYRTTGSARYLFYADISDPSGMLLPVRPHARPVVSASTPKSSTLMYVVRNLRPATAYRLDVAAVVDPHSFTVSFRTSSVVVEVHST